MIDCSEHIINFKQHNIYSLCYSSTFASKTPLIIIHGGPGFCQYYLEPLHRLANERPVIFYDQLDCGQSDKPNDSSNWTIKYYLQELTAVIEHYNWQKVILLGHSWGALLAAEYALCSSKVSQLILASPFLSSNLWMQTARKNIKSLSRENRKLLESALKQQTFDFNSSTKACEEYYLKFVYGSKNLSLCVEKSSSLSSKAVYNFMWGPTEFLINGSLKSYEVENKLKNLLVPVLFTCGKYDEASPSYCKTLSKHIPNSKLCIFKASAHNPHLTESESYIKAIRLFIS